MLIKKFLFPSSLLLHLLGISDHDVHLHGFRLTLKVNSLLVFEAHLAVDLYVHSMRAFEIADCPLLVGLATVSNADLLPVSEIHTSFMT